MDAPRRVSPRTTQASATNASGRNASRRHTATPAGTGRGADWLSLTDLGRMYGISAVQAGRLLTAAGLRGRDGEPSEAAIAQGLARRQHPGHHHQALWHGERCGPHLEGQGVEPQRQRWLVGLWADLIHALQQGSPSISTTAEEMAEEIPSELVSPVNRELRARGCSFQVERPLRRGAGPRPACSPSPASDGAAPHPCG